LSKREKEFPIPSNPFFIFILLFSSSSYQISRYFFPVVVKTHTATFQWESINGWKGPQSGHKTKKIFQKKLDVENVKNVLDGRYFGNAKSKADGGNEDSPSHLNLL
jgi:hypothetical protein